MKIAICYTKPTLHGIGVTKAFLKGVKANGDEVSIIDDYSDLPKLDKCDASFQVCEAHFAAEAADDPLQYHPHGMYAGHPIPEFFRSAIRDRQDKIGNPRIILDNGYMRHIQNKSGFLKIPRQSRSNQKDWGEYYCSIGWGGIKRSADYCNANSPPDRLHKLNEDYDTSNHVSVPSWREDGKHILLLGQNESGVGTANIRKLGLSFSEWCANTMLSIREHTDRPIVFRPHQNSDVCLMNGEHRETFASIQNVKILNLGRKREIRDDLKKCWCAVAAASNAVVECVMSGIPVITSDTLSMAYDISSHSMSEIENPKKPDITQWLYDLCYTQWLPKEMKTGEAWAHLRKRLE